jgi:glycosyltransferase involved in cell wall biosynthesis
MVSYDLQDFGGLEEYATNLALGLKQQRQEVSFLSPAWISPSNQYLRRLRSGHISIVQPAEWISKPVSDWSTKEKILRVAMLVFSPLTLLLGIGLSIFKRRSLGTSRQSAYNWLKGQLMDHLIGPDRRKYLGILLLNWWRIRWHPDILHVHDFSNNLAFVIEWGHDKNIPVIYEVHATPDLHFDLWRNFHADLGRAANIIAVSEKSAQALCEVCGVPHPLVVRGPLLPDPFQSGWQKAAERRQDDVCRTITTIARFIPMKGLKYLLEAAALVKSKYPDVQFEVYGEGELHQELITMASQLGLRSEEIFLGQFSTREELYHIMAKTDVFVLPSLLEGQPVVIVEAMAYGCPIVATAVGGVPELIQDGINGLLCQPANARDLAQKIQMLVEDPALRTRLGVAARASYEQGPFQIKSATERFISIYTEALKRQD